MAEAKPVKAAAGAAGAAKTPAAKGAGSRKTVDKWKKKKWYTIVASRIFDRKTLGETPIEKPKNLIGRTLRITLDTLTGQRAKRDYIVTFKVHDVQGTTAGTKISRFEVNKGVLGRSVRRRNSKVAIVDKVAVVGGDARITMVAITERKAANSQETAIRNIIKKELENLRGKDFEDLVNELLMGNFSNEVFTKASKVYVIKRIIPAKAVFEESK